MVFSIVSNAIKGPTYTNTRKGKERPECPKEGEGRVGEGIREVAMSLLDAVTNFGSPAQLAIWIGWGLLVWFEWRRYWWPEDPEVAGAAPVVAGVAVACACSAVYLPLVLSNGLDGQLRVAANIFGPACGVIVGLISTELFISAETGNERYELKTIPKGGSE